MLKKRLAFIGIGAAIAATAVAVWIIPSVAGGSSSELDGIDTSWLAADHIAVTPAQTHDGLISQADAESIAASIYPRGSATKSALVIYNGPQAAPNTEAWLISMPGAKPNISGGIAGSPQLPTPTETQKVWMVFIDATTGKFIIADGGVRPS